MARTRPIHLGKQGYKKLWLVMSADERRSRNGDKRTAPSMSSTGVPLPTKEALAEIHEQNQAQRDKKGQANQNVNPKHFVELQNMGHKK